ncbi:MAG: YciI family protein, partial [Verrucomicrobiota bacterium]
GEEGRTISGRNGRQVADGPFAETKEAVGGYLLLYADGFEEAVRVAQSCPSLAYGVSIEVRPVLDECPVFQRIRAQQAAEAVNA